VGLAVDFIPNTCHFYKISWEVFIFLFFYLFTQLSSKQKFTFYQKKLRDFFSKKKNLFPGMCIHHEKREFDKRIVYYFWRILLFLAY
jgi:hypothetical protein